MSKYSILAFGFVLSPESLSLFKSLQKPKATSAHRPWTLTLHFSLPHNKFLAFTSAVLVLLIVCLLVCFCCWTEQLACFFYCSHNTESYIWTGLMGFSVIPLLWCWPGQAAKIFWPLFSLLKQLFPPVTSGSRWKMVYVGLCVFQLGHCSERVQRCNREKCCNECWEALWCQRW